MMNESLLDHNLIEYLLTLFEIPESASMDASQLAGILMHLVH